MLRSRGSLAFVLFFCVAVSFLHLAYPMYVIRPFRAQGARELVVALVVSRYRVIVTMISALVALMTLIEYWRVQPGRWRRVLAAVGTGLACVFAGLAHVNVYELMFHPIDRAKFSLAGKSKLDGGEKVIAVIVNGEARAYPIRAMGYHHIINDEVGKTAIVATY